MGCLIWSSMEISNQRTNFHNPGHIEMSNFHRKQLKEKYSATPSRLKTINDHNNLRKDINYKRRESRVVQEYEKKTKHFEKKFLELVERIKQQNIIDLKDQRLDSESERNNIIQGFKRKLKRISKSFEETLEFKDVLIQEVIERNERGKEENREKHVKEKENIFAQFKNKIKTMREFHEQEIRKLSK